MITIQLTRTSKKGNAVYGKMVLPFSARPVYDRNEKDITIVYESGKTVKLDYDGELIKDSETV